MRPLILTGILCLLLVDVAVSLDKERDCKCRIQSKKRIIGGREADPMAYRWQVSIQNKERKPVPDHLRKLVPESEKIDPHFCGGSIINNWWIVTAAHSFYGDEPEDLVVAYGDNDLVTIYETKQWVEVETWVIHGDYSGYYLNDDIALVKLKQPLSFSESVGPACLPAEVRSLYEGTLKISGYGSVEAPVEYPRGRRTKGHFIRYLIELFKDILGARINEHYPCPYP